MTPERVWATRRGGTAHECYLRRRDSVEEAVEALAGGARPVAGGTDLVVGARQGKKPLPDSARRDPPASTRCAASPLPAAGCASARSSTHEEIESHPVVRERFTGLADASAIVGSHATRANGTIGGNVMNASPAMDTGAPLICLGATVVLQGPAAPARSRSTSSSPGPARRPRRPDELLIAVDLPAPAAGTGSALRPARVPPADGDRDRRRRRRGHDRGRPGHGGEASPSRRSRRPSTGSPAAEEALVGTDGGRAAATRRRRCGGRGAAPISDVRGSADYRRAMAAVIARRAIEAAIARAGGADVGIPASSSTYGAV